MDGIVAGIVFLSVLYQTLKDNGAGKYKERKREEIES